MAGGRRRGLVGRGFAGPPFSPGMPQRRRDHRGYEHADGRERIPRGKVGQCDPLAAEQIPASGEQGRPGGGAERIASRERGVKVEFPAGNDEFAALIGSFNRMSERLQRSEEEVETSRAGLQRKNLELEERRRL